MIPAVCTFKTIWHLNHAEPVDVCEWSKNVAPALTHAIQRFSSLEDQDRGHWVHWAQLGRVNHGISRHAA